jgi:hypothetical protein
MSGPIVRKYGFPNFDRIFGKRPLQHGVDATERAADQSEKTKTAKSEKKTSAKPKSSKSKKK